MQYGAGSERLFLQALPFQACPWGQGLAASTGMQTGSHACASSALGLLQPQAVRF